MGPPGTAGGLGGRQPPSKNNLMDAGYDIFGTRIRILGPGSGFWDHDLIFLGTRIRILRRGSGIFGSTNMKFCLKWVHMARYELILRLDGALWPRIIFKPLLTPKRAIQIKNDPNNLKTGWGRAGIIMIFLNLNILKTVH